MKEDELCDEPKEMKCQGEGIISGCKREKDDGGDENGERKAKKRG